MRSTSLRKEQWLPRFTYYKIKPFDLGDAVFQVVRFDHGEQIADHYHEQTQEVFLVLAGKGRIVLNGTTHYAKRGDIFLIEPFDAHAIYTDHDRVFSPRLTIAIFKPHEYHNDIRWGRP